MKVSKSPGRGHEIGRPGHWCHAGSDGGVFDHLDGHHVFDLSVDAAPGACRPGSRGGRPAVQHLDDAHAAGSIKQPLRRGLTCRSLLVPERLDPPAAAREDTLLGHLNLGFYGKFWNGWRPTRDLDGRIWNRGGLEKYPPNTSREASCSTSPGCTASTSTSTTRVRDHAEGHAPDTSRSRTSAPPRGGIRVVHTGRMNVWPDFDTATLKNTPRHRPRRVGRGLCEAGRDVHHRRRHDRPRVPALGGEDVFLPVLLHVATAGAQIIEVVDMNEIAIEKRTSSRSLVCPSSSRRHSALMRLTSMPLRSR